MKYVILLHRRDNETTRQPDDRTLPFLFSETLPHDVMASAFISEMLRQFPGSECGVMSAGMFDPEFGPQRGAPLLGIDSCEISSDESKADDFIICTHDKTKGRVRT